MKNNKIKYLIGIDACGTKYIARVTDINGCIIDEGLSGPANITAVGAL